MNSDTVQQIPWEKWGNFPWLRDRTILLTRHGSHAYGLSRPESDIDVKGIAVAPHRMLFGYLNRFDHAETNQPVDMVVYNIQKFCKLAADCNPNIIEVLFTDEKHWLQHTKQAEMLRDNRDLFISKKARYTFAGYAHAQLKRIEGHYKWLKNPPTHKPTRSEFGLPDKPTLPKDHRATLEALVKNQLESWDMDWDILADEAAIIHAKARLETALVEIGVASRESLWEKAARTIGIDDNVMEILAAERRYKSKCDEWDSYQNWLKTRNEKRAELEAKFGFDTKHGMHLMRLMLMGCEIMEGKGVIVERPDREYLLGIRNGQLAYEPLVEKAKALEARMVELYTTSKLPREPNRVAIDSLCADIVESMR